MAIVVFDGFDHYASQADIQARKGAVQWSDIALINGGVTTLVAGRGGYGRAVMMDVNSASPAIFGGSFNANLAGGFMGIAVLLQPVGLSYVDCQVMDYNAGVAQITARFLLDAGTVQVYSGDPNTTTAPDGLSPETFLLAQSPPNAFSPYIWNFIEIGCTTGASGTFDVHVNGNSVVSGAGATVYPAPLPNHASGSSTFNGFRVRSGFATEDALGITIDDFYLCDTTAGPGTFPCNSFLGDSAVRTLYPTANSSVQWAPLASTNWVEVGESQFDGDTSYNAATTVGATDLFTFGSLPTTVSAVFGVQLTGAYRKQDAGANTIVQKVVSGGTTAASAPLSLSLAYSYVTSLVVLDPHTGATWTPTAVNALVAGYTLNS